MSKIDELAKHTIDKNIIRMPILMYCSGMSEDNVEGRHEGGQEGEQKGRKAPMKVHRRAGGQNGDLVGDAYF